MTLRQECHQPLRRRLHRILLLVIRILVGACSSVVDAGIMTMTRAAPTTAAVSLLLWLLLLQQQQQWPCCFSKDMQRRRRKAPLRSSLLLATAAATLDQERGEVHDNVCKVDDGDHDDDEDVYENDGDIVLIKLGGSSLTNKAIKESLNNEALKWFAETLASSITSDFLAPPEEQDETVEEENQCQDSSSNNNNKRSKQQRRKRRTSASSFIIVHGAGSFGHHQAKQFGLQKNGGTTSNNITSTSTNCNHHSHDHHHHHRHQMQGLAQTRLSVQTLNRLVVAALIENNVNAVGISPCFSMTTAMTSSIEEHQQQLVAIVQSTLQAGLVPVLHGDACLFYSQDATPRGGILSGDTIIEWVGSASFVSRVIFLTDVDGVYTSDPRLNSTAELVPLMAASSSPSSSSLHSEPPPLVVIQATGSTHAHDVTGGFTTKLASAIAVAQTGKNVTIVKCGSPSAVQIISQNHRYHHYDVEDSDKHPPPVRATVVYAPRGVAK